MNTYKYSVTLRHRCTTHSWLMVEADSMDEAEAIVMAIIKRNHYDIIEGTIERWT
jgi:NADH:ubiquinone oxidoreductase subunit F (NADH-binding)